MADSRLSLRQHGNRVSSSGSLEMCRGFERHVGLVASSKIEAAQFGSPVTDFSDHHICRACKPGDSRQGPGASGMSACLPFQTRCNCMLTHPLSSLKFLCSPHPAKRYAGNIDWKCCGMHQKNLQWSKASIGPCLKGHPSGT